MSNRIFLVEILTNQNNADDTEDFYFSEISNGYCYIEQEIAAFLLLKKEGFSPSFSYSLLSALIGNTPKMFELFCKIEKNINQNLFKLKIIHQISTDKTIVPVKQQHFLFGMNFLFKKKKISNFQYKKLLKRKLPSENVNLLFSNLKQSSRLFENFKFLEHGEYGKFYKQYLVSELNKRKHHRTEWEHFFDEFYYLKNIKEKYLLNEDYRAEDIEPVSKRFLFICNNKNLSPVNKDNLFATFDEMKNIDNKEYVWKNQVLLNVFSDKDNDWFIEKYFKRKIKVFAKHSFFDCMNFFEVIIRFHCETFLNENTKIYKKLQKEMDQYLIKDKKGERDEIHLNFQISDFYFKMNSYVKKCKFNFNMDLMEKLLEYYNSQGTYMEFNYKEIKNIMKHYKHSDSVFIKGFIKTYQPPVIMTNNSLNSLNGYNLIQKESKNNVINVESVFKRNSNNISKQSISDFMLKRIISHFDFYRTYHKYDFKHDIFRIYLNEFVNLNQYNLNDYNYMVKDFNILICSEVVDFKYETRCFILDGKLIATSPCMRKLTPAHAVKNRINPIFCDHHNSEKYFEDRKMAAKMAVFARNIAKDIKKISNRNGYGMYIDIGFDVKDQEWKIIEIHDNDAMVNAGKYALNTKRIVDAIFRQ